MATIEYVVKKDGKYLSLGDTVTDFQGETYILVGFSQPRHEGSTGRVDLKDLDGNYVGQFFPSVINACIVRKDHSTEEQLSAGELATGVE